MEIKKVKSFPEP